MTAITRDMRRRIYKMAADEMYADLGKPSLGPNLPIVFASYRLGLSSDGANDVLRAFMARCGRKPHGGLWSGGLHDRYAHRRAVRLLDALAAGRGDEADEILDEIDKENPP